MNVNVRNHDKYRSNINKMIKLLDIQMNVFDKGNYYSAYTGVTNLLFALLECNEMDFIDYLLKNIKNYKISNKRLSGMLELKGMNI